MDVPKFKPITKECIEETCGKAFTTSVGEQEFYFSKEMPLPKRCKECRERRKARINREVRHVEE